MAEKRVSFRLVAARRAASAIRAGMQAHAVGVHDGNQGHALREDGWQGFSVAKRIFAASTAKSCRIASLAIVFE